MKMEFYVLTLEMFCQRNHIKILSDEIKCWEEVHYDWLK